MFHVEHIFPLLCCPVGFLLTGQSWADSSPPNNLTGTQPSSEISSVSEPTPSPAKEESTEPKDEPLLVLPIASSSEELKQQLTVGWQDLLMGWEESARHHFEQALRHDEHCALAHAGLLLAFPEGKQEHIQSLQNICGEDSNVLLTPAESFYLSAFLQAANRHLEAAAREMNEHADRYRADLFATLWGIQLLHCADIGYTQEGEVRPLQAKALRRAQALYRKHPSHPLVCYLRAYLEEAAPNISAEALEAAQKAAELMPRHPMSQLLLGHLLYRSQREEEALTYFQQAASLAKAESNETSALFLTASLYEATTLWSIGQDRKSLQLRRRLRAIPLPTDRKESASPAATLLRWEARTLPLRILILRKRVPTQGEIEAAFQAATPEHPSDIDFVLEERNCLRAALSARKKAGAGDMKEAVPFLHLAEEALTRFDATLTQAREVSPHWVTPWYRAREACLIALCTAKAEVYPSSADIWKENARQAVQPPVLLLPPPVPMRSTTTTAAPSPTPSSARSASGSSIKRSKAASRPKSSSHRASGKQPSKKSQCTRTRKQGKR